MADPAPSAPWTEVLRSLEQTGVRRRDGDKRIGRKAFVLGRLAREGIGVPRAWVLEASWFDAFVERCLPRKHDLKTLVRLSGSKVGDERCARAYEVMLAEPLPDELVAAIEGLYEDELAAMPRGVAVRPSLAASGRLAGAAMRHLHSLVGLTSAEAIAEAVRSVWASSVLSSAVAAYAHARLRSVSMALIIQQAVVTDEVGLLTRTTGPSRPVADDEWHLGALVDDEEPRRWRRRPQILFPLSVGQGGEAPPAELARMRDALEPNGLEMLLELGRTGEEQLGVGAVFHFALERRDGEGTIHLLNADESPRWQSLRGGTDSTTWTEITLGGRSPEPPTRLTQSVVDRVVDGAVESVLASFRCELNDEGGLISRWSGRSYLNTDALAEATVDVPLLEPEDLLSALGGVDDERMRALAGRTAARGKSAWRTPLISATALTEQFNLEPDVRDLERAIERDARGLDDMDLTLLPSDAMATTLTSGQALLERSAELWAKCAAGQLAHMVAIRSLIRRRVPDAPAQVGFAITRGQGGQLSTNLAASAGRTLETLRDDPAAVAALVDPAVRLPSDLPDGWGRGALGQFLARYGDVCFAPFELSVPRWREDASTLFAMFKLLIDAGAGASGDALQRNARTDADTELARYEPALNGLERRLLRSLVDRAKDLLRRRHTIDRLLFRALGLMRHVVVDIDRRLRRLDPSMGSKGAFHCSAARLAKSLKSGRPELSRVIRMRDVERDQHAAEPAPPISFVASPPRGGIPVVPTVDLAGIGVSPGVVEGRVRIVRGLLPERLERGDILVVTTFDPALAPLCLVAGGVITEAGGTLSLGAEAARELAVPTVMSVAGAALRLQEGETVRLDGARGVVHRLGMVDRTPRPPPVDRIDIDGIIP
jgi:rifampicin phosphotransferase